MLSRDVAARFEAHWPRDTLPERLAVVCAENAGRVALIDGDRRLTFGETAALVERLAGHLAARGVGPGDVVSWQLPNWWEAAVLHHAALRAGATPNPLNPAFRARELRHVVAEARPAALVVPREWRGFDHEALARDLGVPHVLVARGGDLDGLLAEPAREAPSPPADPAAVALLLYTSGTTAAPKGVQHTHRALLYQVETFRAAHALTPDDRFLGGPPVAHVAGLSYSFLAPFALGTSTALVDRWDAARAAALAARARATFMTGPPVFLLTLAEHAGDLPAFRLFSTGGATIDARAIRGAGERLGCVVKRAYGSTEVPFLTATRMDDDERARLETDGRPLGANEIRIAGESDPSSGRPGEIWARGPGMLAGYRDASLDAAITPEGWYRTGDLGEIDADGLLRVTGRIGDVIIRGGENISAAEIEGLLCEHPAVAEAAVVGTPDPVLGERVAAFVVVRDGHAFDFDEMVAHLSARAIARHKLPERLEVRASLPHTESGKVRKAALRAGS